MTGIPTIFIRYTGDLAICDGAIQVYRYERYSVGNPICISYLYSVTQSGQFLQRFRLGKFMKSKYFWIFILKVLDFKSDILGKTALYNKELIKFYVIATLCQYEFSCNVMKIKITMKTSVHFCFLNIWSTIPRCLVKAVQDDISQKLFPSDCITLYERTHNL